MTREEFINCIERYFNSKAEAAECASDYTDEEIAEGGNEIIRDIDEDYRYYANVEHYREHGY